VHQIPPAALHRVEYRRRTCRPYPRDSSDYLLFNPTTHQSAIWHLSGSTLIGAASGPTIAAGYNLIGTADFKGDRKPDYVLYDATTQRTALWYLNDNVLTGAAFGPSLPSGWSLVGP
jgi:hypothetical protein